MKKYSLKYELIKKRGFMEGFRIIGIKEFDSISEAGTWFDDYSKTQENHAFCNLVHFTKNRI